MGKRLRAEDWAHAALAAVAEQGLSGIAVEPLAARLSTTKGSFYWHFANRDALIEAALALWEQTHTEAVIAAVASSSARDPAARLRELFNSVVAGVVGSAGGAIEVNLLAAADHPLVATTMARVVERRLSYLRSIFVELGFPDAALRAQLAYASYLGAMQLGLRVPSAAPRTRAEQSAYVDGVVRILLRA